LPSHSIAIRGKLHDHAKLRALQHGHI